MNFKKHYINYLCLSSLLLLINVLTSCSTDDDEQKISECPDVNNPNCENYVSCDDVETPTADFFLQSTMTGFRDTFRGPSVNLMFSPDDSLFAENFHIEVKHKGHYHQLTVDGATRERESLTTTFTSSFGTEKEASHLIKYEAHEAGCYEAGSDSVKRSYKFVDHYNDFAIFGKFRVAHKGSTDSFDLSTSIVDIDGNFSTEIEINRYIQFVNFHYLDSSIGDTINIPHSTQSSSNGWLFFRPSRISDRGFEGHMEVQAESNKVRIRYIIRDEGPELNILEHELVGRILENYNIQDG